MDTAAISLFLHKTVYGYYARTATTLHGGGWSEHWRMKNYYQIVGKDIIVGPIIGLGQTISEFNHLMFYRKLLSEGRK